MPDEPVTQWATRVTFASGETLVVPREDEEEARQRVEHWARRPRQWTAEVVSRQVGPWAAAPDNPPAEAAAPREDGEP